MTPNEFKSAVMRLLVGPDSSGIVTARPLAQLYLEAASVFTRSGAAAFLWFLKRPVAPIDEGEVRAEFIEWRKKAREKEIKRFVAAAPAYRQALLEEAASDSPQMAPTEKGGVLKGESGRIAWLKIQKLAGFRAGTPRGRGGRPFAADWHP
jgi:hypothetical protein